MMSYNKLSLRGQWEECQAGYYLFKTPESGIVILGIPFHMLAIQTKGEDEQVALHPENQTELDALHTAGGTDSGFSEIEIDGHPAVVFLVPFDR